MDSPHSAFAAFGRVTARIAACEQIMRLALGEREVERAKRNGDAAQERFQRFSQRMLRWDFGQLSQRVRTQLKLPEDPWVQIFKDAKELRNGVAHNFWSPYYALLQSDEGIDIIIRHCNTLDRYFEHLTSILIHATGVNINLYMEFISTKDWKFNTKKDFDRVLRIAEDAIADLPD